MTDRIPLERALEDQRLFESAVREALDAVLVSRGFHLVPQGVAVEGNSFIHAAIYEMPASEYRSRYPLLASHIVGDISCFDIEIKVDRSVPSVSVLLEGQLVSKDDCVDEADPFPFTKQLSLISERITQVLDSQDLG